MDRTTKILTVCLRGNVRSVGTRFILNNRGYCNVIAIGGLNTTTETLKYLYDWADFILLAKPEHSRFFKFLKNMDKDAFLKDELVQNTVIRQVQIIGEASKNLSKELKRKYKHIPWKEIVGMRNILVHKYFNIESMVTPKVKAKNRPK